MRNNGLCSSGSIRLVGLMTIVLIVLKLTNVVAWSWVWVLSPIWMITAIVTLLLVIIGIVTVALEVEKYE